MRTLGILSVIVLAGLLGPGTAFAQSECENACADCPTDPEMWENLGFGVSLWMTWFEPTEGCIDQFRCAPWAECRGPAPMDAEPPEVLDAEIEQLFALDRVQVPEWVRANRGGFELAVVDGTLRVANPCGAVITWVALEPSQIPVTRALLDEA